MLRRNQNFFPGWGSFHSLQWDLLSLVSSLGISEHTFTIHLGQPSGSDRRIGTCLQKILSISWRSLKKTMFTRYIPVLKFAAMICRVQSVLKLYTVCSASREISSENKVLYFTWWVFDELQGLAWWSNLLQNAIEQMMDELVDEVTLGLCFEVHRSVKKGTFFLDDNEKE